jgi:hypothetical protein
MATLAASPLTDLKAAASAIAARYRTVSAHETETAVALLVLWALDALDSARITAADATAIVTALWVSITDLPSGPDLSETIHELLEESTWLHDEAIGQAPDHAALRHVAHGILERSS